MRHFIKHGVTAILICSLFIVSFQIAFAQTPFTPDTLVRQKCSACHKPDQQGRLEVIEETRKTPEEWINVVERMIRINGGPIEDENFNAVIKELSKYLILTPEEMKTVAYINSDENSQYREIPKDDVQGRIFGSCVRCHTYGKIASHMKTPAQWKENMALHIGYYPTTLAQMRELDWIKESDELAEILAKMYPHDTEKWREWMKHRKDQDISGTWQIAGFQPGMGYYEGRYVIQANFDKGEDEYLVERHVRYDDGTALTMQGAATLHGEYHLRYALAPTALTGRIEGVFDLNAADMGFKGKWWTLIQDTNAYGDEVFYKTGRGPSVFGMYPRSVRADGQAHTITLVGVDLPGNVSPADIRINAPGLQVSQIKQADETKIVCSVTADATAAPGRVTVSVQQTVCDIPLTVFNRIDRIKVFPELGRARISSGAAYPPQGVQFTAMGISNGRDGKPDTADDLLLDPVKAQWALMEEKTRDDDDDLKYLDTSILNGLYTPVTTYGPIAERHQNREGVGLIAVGATFSDQDRQLAAQSLLAVTVPDFIPHIK